MTTAAEGVNTGVTGQKTRFFGPNPPEPLVEQNVNEPRKLVNERLGNEPRFQSLNADFDESEMARRLRESGWADRSSIILPDEHDQKVLRKLLGISEADRFQRSKGRPFRWKPPVVTAEYYERPPDHLGIGGGWSITVFENGVRRNTKGGMTRSQCLSVIRRLEKRGVRTKLFVTEAMRKEQEAAQEALSRPHHQECQKGSDRYFRRFGGLG